MSQRPEISMEEQERIVGVLVSILNFLRRADPKLEDCLLCTNHSEDDILVSIPACGHVLGIRCLVGFLSSHGTACPICTRECDFEGTLDAGFLPDTSSQVCLSANFQAATDAFDQTLDRINRFLEKSDKPQTDNLINTESSVERVDSDSQLSATASSESALSVKNAIELIPPPPPAHHAGISFMVQRARVITRGSSTDSLSRPMGFESSPNPTRTPQKSSRGFMGVFSRKAQTEPRPSLDAAQQKAHESMQEEPTQQPSEITPEELIKLGQELFRMAAEAKTGGEE